MSHSHRARAGVLIICVLLLSILMVRSGSETDGLHIDNSPNGIVDADIHNDPVDDLSSRSEPLSFQAPTWESGDYWVLVRDGSDIMMDESDDQRSTVAIHDEKTFTMVAIEPVTTSAGTFQCYKLVLTGIVKASGDGVQSLGGIKVNYHFELTAQITGEIWVRTSDMAFVKIHYTADGDAETNTVLGTIHQYQDLYMEYNEPELTFGFPIIPGVMNTYMNDVRVTGIKNIEGQTNGDEAVDESHHIDMQRRISDSTQTVTVPSGTYESGASYQLAGRNFDCWKVSGTDTGGYHSDGDSISPPSGGTVVTYFSAETGFYTKQVINNLWSGWSGTNEYTIQSTEILTDYSYLSELPVIEAVHSDQIINDGVDQGNVTVEVSDGDGLLDIKDVFIDLSSLSMGDHLEMYDDGTHGDIQENDGIFTVTGITTTTSPLSYYLPVTVRDLSGNEVGGNVEMRVSDFRDLPPLATEMSASPIVIKNDEKEVSLLSLKVEDDNGLEEVLVDLGPIGGNDKARMYDDGTHRDIHPEDSVFSLEVTAALNCTGGAKLLEIKLRDNGNNEISAFISLMVVDWNKAPEMTPLAIESIRNDGEDTTLVSVKVIDKEDNLVNVFVDASLIGGHGEEPLYDDGTHGDEIPNDDVFSLEITVWKNYSYTMLLLNITAVDSAGAASTISAYLDVEMIGSPPVLTDAEASSSVMNDGQDMVRITVDYYDRENNINWIKIDLANLGIAVPKGMLLQKGQATIDLTVDPEIKPGIYNLTITAMDLDWKMAKILVIIEVVEPRETGENVDTDNDGMPDWWEKRYGLDPYTPGDANEDWNNNGRTNLEEYIKNSNPITSSYDLVFVDSDYDGMPDWWENHYSLNPYNSKDALRDANRDGVINLHEYYNGTNPITASGTLKDTVDGSAMETTITEGELARRMDNLLLIMIINGVFVVFSVILFLLERRWRKRSIIKDGTASQKDMQELETRIESKLNEQNELIKDLIDVINEASLLKRRV